ncbi:MAG: YceD family protein [Woeseiaceae bacterium]|nr:YceD family protein [Woeseiaceae bacterium]
MSNPLRDLARPEELAERCQAFDCKGKISDFPRLVEIVEADLAAHAGNDPPRAWRRAPVAIRLGFGWADSRRDVPALEAEISTEIAAVCQRCLETFSLPLSSTLRVLLLKSAMSASPTGEFDIWELEDEVFRPADIVEEALIMALPLSAKHQSRAQCGPLADTVSDENRETVRPFVNLRSLMDKTNN